MLSPERRIDPTDGKGLRGDLSAMRLTHDIGRRRNGKGLYEFHLVVNKFYNYKKIEKISVIFYIFYNIFYYKIMCLQRTRVPH